MQGRAEGLQASIDDARARFIGKASREKRRRRGVVALLRFGRSKVPPEQSDVYLNPIEGRLAAGSFALNAPGATATETGDGRLTARS